MAEPDPLSVLIVDDEDLTARALQKMLLSAGHSAIVTNSGEEALENLSRQAFDLIITDLMMPGMDGFALVKKAKNLYPRLLIFIFTGHDSFSMARKALNLGADHFLLKPVDKDQLDIALTQAREKIQLKTKIAHLNKMVKVKYSPSNIIGNSKPLQRVFRLIDKAKSSNANVLIQGESGTGKELVARAIYSALDSRISNFVGVNCCAISEGLIESELFGHVRGAFSGAVADRQGLFEVAHNGIIFLDEIGELSTNIQTKLLRVIQEREVRRVGDNKIRYVNVRIIASTNRNLEEAIKNESFREDLYYRLNVIPIHLPPLRNRLNDVPQLANHFLKKHATPGNPIKFSADALILLQSYQYPGNIRELENITQRAISFCSGEIISGQDIQSYLEMEPQPPYKFDNLQNMAYPILKQRLDELEKDYLTYHLEEAEGNVIKAARKIGISRTAFHNKVKKMAIDLEAIRTAIHKGNGLQGPKP